MNKDVSSAKYYSSVSNNYRFISKSRELYLKKIDDLIIEFVDFPVIEYLDVGAGDGYRTKIIAKAINAKKITLLDNCYDMYKTSEFNNQISFINQDIQSYSCDKEYDIITCLWNVLGHVGNKVERFRSMQSMHSLLKPNGILIIDVNNRFNISHYGFLNVFKNRIESIFKRNDSGYFLVGLGDIRTKVYIHRPGEINEIASKVGFEVIEEKYIDYKTGLEVDASSKGQLFYVLKKNN